jgi:DUF4097 and DUF4098 domain-containing protein YvlB
MKYALRMAGLTATALLLVGCEDWGEWGDSGRFKEDFHHSYDLKPGGKVSLENSNGSIEILGWDQNTIDISGTKYASTEAVIKALKIDIVSSPDSVRIRTVPPTGHRGNWGAKYVIRLPRKVELERIASSNGGIRIEDLDGSARLRTSNGNIRITRLNGPVEVETSNGGVEVMEHNGSLVAKTSNGGIRADNVRGLFEATTSNGSINARLADPQPGKPVKLDSSNGSVTLTMDAVRENDVRITTSNSSITLKLPASARGLLKANTSNSNVTTDFDVNIRSGQLSKSHVEGQLNGGTGPTFDLSTSNGTIRILKL